MFDAIIDLLKETAEAAPKSVIIAAMLLGGAIIISNIEEGKE